MSYQSPLSSTPQAQSQPAEGRALNKIVWFCIINLAAVVGGWVGSIFFFSAGFWWSIGTSLGPNPTAAQVAAALDPLFRNIAYLAAVGLALGLAALLLLTSGLRDLAKVDRQRFGTPSLLLLFAIVGLVLVAVGIFPLFINITSVIAQAANTPSGVPSQAFFSALGSLIIYATLLCLGGIIALVGVIGGEILGLWRVGEKYDQTVVKIGAIFFIIPVLNILAPILVLVGAWEAKKRLMVV